MRCFLTFTAIVVAAVPGVALAQPPSPPVVELGAQVSRKFDNPAPVTWSPRITLNLSHLTAIEGTADIQKSFGYEYDPGTRTSARGFGAHWRQTLFTSGRWQVFGVLGAGMNRVEQNFAERIFQGRDGPVIIPASTFIDTEATVHLGPAVQFEAAPWLALRGDVRLTVGENNGGLRGMVGAVVPLTRFRAGDRPTGSAPPLAAWQRVKPGREVWVTTDAGALLHGEVAAITGSALNIRQRTGDVSISLDDIRLVEGRDSLQNGVIIGGASGGIAGAALFTWAASVFCETDDCESFEGVAALLGAAGGFAVGGLLGAMVDGLIPGRKTLVGGNTISLKPVMTPTRKAMDVTIRWR